MLEEVLMKLSELSQQMGYNFGIAGSVARGEETKDSDIDIVVDYDILDFDQIDFIKGYFNRDVDVIQLPLLKEEDERLDALAVSLDLPINDVSVYKTIVQDVIWCK